MKPQKHNMTTTEPGTMPTRNDCRAINNALRSWLTEPMTDEQSRVYYELSNHEIGDDLIEVWNQARDIVGRNVTLPNNFTESLDSCRLVELRLTPAQRHRYHHCVTARMEGYALLAPPQLRAEMLCLVLDLGVGL